MLTEEQQLDLLKDEIDGYVKILSERDIEVKSFDDLAKLTGTSGDRLSLSDFRRIKEHYKMLARTPI